MRDDGDFIFNIYVHTQTHLILIIAYFLVFAHGWHSLWCKLDLLPIWQGDKSQWLLSNSSLSSDKRFAWRRQT